MIGSGLSKKSMWILYTGLLLLAVCSWNICCLSIDGNIATTAVVLTDTGKIICGFHSTNTANITIKNKGLSIIPQANSGKSNYEVLLYLSDVNGPSGSHFLKLNVSHDGDQTKGLALGESLDFHVTFQGYINHEKCFSYKYLCTEVHPSIDASFSEAYVTDNALCIGSSQFLQPTDVDVELNNVNFTNANPIVRKVPGPYNVSLDVTLKDSIYPVNKVTGDNVNFNIWYFTTDNFPPVECKETAEGQEYVGEISVTADGLQCEQWIKYSQLVSTLSFSEQNLEKVKNFCRNPDKSPSGPWCYVNSAKRLCDIPMCPSSEFCRHYTNGKEYTGKQNKTVSGLACQRWDQQIPHNHGFSSLSNEENYCRSPASLPGGPWCYTTNPAKQFESCGIPNCYPDAKLYLEKSYTKKVQNILLITQGKLDLSENHKLEIQVPIDLDVETCLESKYLCLIISDDPTGTYVEKDYTNNMKCIDIKPIKSCKPVTDIKPETITFSAPPVRGYATSVEVNVKIKNMDKNIPIADVQNEASNFKVNVFLTNYDLKTIGDPFNSFKIAVPLNTSLSQLQTGVKPQESITVSGMGTFLVEREKCLLVTQVCVEVIPGLKSSYSIYPGTNHLACFTADHRHKNCIGIQISGIELHSLQKFGKSDGISYFSVTWDQGTDVYFTIEFGDNSEIYSWNWKNTESADFSPNITVNHKFTEMGNYNIHLRAWNNINSLTHNHTFNVEPDLASKNPYLQISSSYSPSTKPVAVTLYLHHVKPNLDLPIDVVCDIMWGDGVVSKNGKFQLTTTTPGSLTHTYQKDAADVIAEILCNNFVSSVSYKHLLIFRDQISGLQIVSHQNAFATNDNVMFNVTMKTGSNVKLHVEFGDGSKQNYTNTNVHTSTFTWVISHAYKASGNYSVFVTAFNEHFKNTTSLPKPVIIQNPISDIAITGPSVIRYPTGNASFHVVKQNPLLLSSEVFCHWFLNDISMSSEAIYLGKFSTGFSLIHTFSRNNIYRQSIVKVKCINLVSERVALFTTRVMEEIKGVSAPLVTMAAVNKLFYLSLNTKAGSEVYFIVNFGDGETMNVTHSEIDSTNKAMKVSHTYKSVGNYTVNILCQNIISQEEIIAKVVVYNEIVNISVSVDETIIWPPALATVLIQTGTNQMELVNLNCVLAYGRVKHLYIDRLDHGHSFAHKINFPKSAIMKGSINISCSNQITEIVVSKNVNVILDAVHIASLQSTESVWWTNKTHMTLYINRFATNSCFLWDMGDGTKYIHGVKWCQTNATQKGINLNLITSGIDFIKQSHTYKTWGTYTVKVIAFNHVSEDSVSNTTRVKDWYCNKPKVQFPERFTNPVNFTEIMRGLAYTIEPDHVMVDCMKSLNKTESLITVYNYTTNAKLMVMRNVSKFQYQPRSLPIGLYYAEYTLMMLGVNHINTTAKFYFEVIETPLLASIEGSNHEVWNFNEAVTINAFDGTVDPDLDPNTSQGITFEWYCRQLKEEFNLDSQGKIILAGPANLSSTNAESFSGCFGGGPGKLTETSGKFVLETGMMIPNTTFVLFVVASKGEKSAENSKVITLEDPAAPKVTIQCQENCQAKKRITGSLLLATNCTDNCKTKYGDVQYFWSLEWYNKATGNSTKYTNLGDITLTGNTDAKLLIKPNTLVGGVWHNATLVAWTPYSLKTIVTYSFLTNLPPYGGNCWIEPTSGYVMETFFELKCEGWREWLLNNDVGLKYEYRVRALGKHRSYLLYYGSKPGSDKANLPMGNYKMNFLNEVVLYILDTVGDYFLLVQNVTVSPSRIPKTEMLHNILKELNDSSSRIGQLIKNKQYQLASSRVFSMLSMVNLPSDVQTVNYTEDQNEILHLKTIVRTAIIEKISSFPITSMDALDQTNELLMGSVESPKELEIKTLDKAAGKLKSMSDFYIQNRGSSTPEKKKQLVTDMTSTCLGMIISSDTNMKDSPKVNDSSLNTTATNRTNSPLRSQVGTIMKKSVAVMDSLTDAQLDDKEIGTPADIISFNQLTLVIEKQDASKLSNTKFSTNQGGVEMGELNGDIAHSKCVKKSTVLSAINPLMWDETADSVTSSVLKFGLTECDDKQTGRKKRAASGGNSFNVELAVQNVEEAKYVHTNRSDGNGMIFNYLDLTGTAMPVIASVYPDEHDTLEVYVQFNKKPTLQDYYEIVTIPKGINDTNILLADLYELNHAVFISSENLTKAAALSVYIGVRRFGCKEGESCRDNITYSYKLSQTQCQIWNSKTETWASEGCEVLPGSTPKKVKFKSNLFGSMGAGLFVGPNTIDFGNVFNDFGKKMAENAAVFWTVIGVIILYFPCMILCRMFDKKDRRKWMILPLCDNNNEHEYGYEVHVYTGMKSGSGTSSRINFILAGTDTDTGMRYLNDSERKNFETGDVNSFLMRTKHSLGIPCTLRIWHDNSGTGKNADWYLAKVVVVDLQTQQWYLFMCDDWLSTEQSDGMTERILNTTTVQDLEAGQPLMENNIKRKLFDDHLWLSIGYRKTRSTFTRVQRLSCCFAVLYLTMVSNAMWSGTEEAGQTQSAFTIGPISLTVHQLYTSLMSSLIVVPPAILISVLFAKRDTSKKKKRSKKGTISTSNIPLGARERDDEVRVKKKKMLPYWCVFIAYFLIFLSVACGAFFTILYAFEWGKAKSEEWLLAFVMSFVQSVLLIQPMKVVVVAALLSFLFKKDTDVTDYEDKIGKMQLGDQHIKPANKDILKMSKELSEEEKYQLKKKQILDKKMNQLLKEIIYDALFLFLLLWVVMGNQNENVFLQNKDLRNVFLRDIESVQRHDDVWTWVKDILLPGLYLTQNYNSDDVDPYDEKFISNGYAMRLGPPRLRQLRVNSDVCKIAKEMEGFISTCTKTLETHNEEHNNYYPSWRITREIGNMTLETLPPIEKSFTFKTEEEMNGLSYWGLFQWYSGAGYVANLGNTLDEAQSLIDQLENKNWIDEYTKVVFIEFNVWNANSNLFNLFVLTFEFPSAGNAFNWLTVDSVNLYRYAGAGGLMNLLAEIILTIFIIVITVMEVVKMVKSKGMYFKYFWNLILVFCLLCYYIGLGVYAWRSVLTASTVEEMMNNRGKSVNFRMLVSANTIFMFVMGLMSFLMELRLLNTLRYIKSVSVMVKTLAKAVNDILNVSIGFTVLFIAYVSVLFLKYGYRLFEYRAFGSTATFLTTAFLGTKLNFPNTIQETGYFGAFILLSYLLLMILFWLNLFISVLDEYMKKVQKDEEFQSINFEVIGHMMKAVTGIIKSSDKSKAKKDEDMPPLTYYKQTNYENTEEQVDHSYTIQKFPDESSGDSKNQKKEQKYEFTQEIETKSEKWHQSNTIHVQPATEEYTLPKGSEKDVYDKLYDHKQNQKKLNEDLDQLFANMELHIDGESVATRPWQLEESSVLDAGDINTAMDSGISSVMSSQKDLRSLDSFQHGGQNY